MISREWKRHKLAVFLPKFIGACGASIVYGFITPPFFAEMLAAYISSIAVGIAAYSMISLIYEHGQKQFEMRTMIQVKSPIIAKRALHDPEFDPTPR